MSDKLRILCQYLETLYEYHLIKSETDPSPRSDFSYGAAFAYLDILKQLYADFV